MLVQNEKRARVSSKTAKYFLDFPVDDARSLWDNKHFFAVLLYILFPEINTTFPYGTASIRRLIGNKSFQISQA